MDYGYKDAQYKTPAYLLDSVVAALQPLRARGASSLFEIGCGNGYVAAELAQSGWQVTATEVSAEGVNVARAEYGSSGVRFEEASIYDLDLASRFNRFDVVLSIEVIEHLQYPRELFRKSFELLKPGGTLILTTPYHGYLKNLAIAVTGGWDKHFGVDWDVGHIKFFSPATLGRMAAECGFVNPHWRGLGRIPGLWKSFLYSGERAIFNPP